MADTEEGSRIKENMENHEYCDDEVVVKCIQNEIKDVETTGRNWILQGFPRTKYQALSLQRMGIIPDRVILLNQTDEFTRFQIKENLLAMNSTISDALVDDLTEKKLHEYHLHKDKVSEVFGKSLFEL